MAIAFDASSNGMDTFVGPLTWDHTCAGANRLLVVTAQGASAAGSGITGVTYNSVSLTKLDSLRNGGASGRWLEMWYLIAPATGTHSITISGVVDIGGCASSYTGVKQSGFPDASNKAQNTGTSLTVSVVTVADKCWTVCSEGNNNGNPFPGTGLIDRVSDGNGMGIFDSNGLITPPQSYAMTTTIGSSNTEAMICASFAPASTENPAFLLTMI